MSDLEALGGANDSAWSQPFELAFLMSLNAALIECNGELKTELDRLCATVERASEEDVPARMQVLTALKASLKLYEGNDYRTGAGMLSRASRIWWSSVAP